MVSDAEMELDRLSKPFRDAALRWAHERGEGISGGWKQNKHRWFYQISDISIEIYEAGDMAVVWRGKGHKSVAKTPSGLRRLLSQLYKQASDWDEPSEEKK